MVKLHNRSQSFGVLRQNLQAPALSSVVTRSKCALVIQLQEQAGTNWRNARPAVLVADEQFLQLRERELDIVRLAERDARYLASPNRPRS